MLERTVVIDIVGMSQRLIGENTPFLKKRLSQKPYNHIKPLVPAVTCTIQSTYLTGKPPADHGIVGNGWYSQDECEIKFWKQSNKLVQGPKIWDELRKIDPAFTCANMFWWYNMYSSVDYSVTPRPNYLADGRKIPDAYSHPPQLRDQLQQELGQFPLFEFWGPRTTIRSSKWIADSSMITEKKFKPTLSLVYLPHLDYCLQKYGQDVSRIKQDLLQIDALVEDLVNFYENRGVKVVLLSEYGITNVNRPVALNRVLRTKGWLQIREERGLELLDAGASKAFAVVDHQVAHVYVRDKENIASVKALLEEQAGVAEVWGSEQKELHRIDHSRSGDLMVIAEPESWFTYYYWHDDKRAPDFARTVEIHKKPGYDPVELFTDPEISWLTARVGWKLLKKKLGFRVLMDIIPLDPTLIRGSHGVIPGDPLDWPIIVADGLTPGDALDATDVYGVLMDQLRT
ncbi:MAG: alkaline phosphatase family protein [Cyclobacteriaceae bacterium]|nr:MAG: alkaline phosphatase family protein [Cyclobacteriaceae bacterium]